ncbi:Cupin [Paenibacillus konkukensis]|uniref:Cupin n=1 Tax=Paenibacillus konkukensis TaxID=2020716 RepID=A0ABY4RSY2_9BACL|nr:cupin domain-containing protein [Paenibacillus konkukensis]UQZ85145.1 Cupin [Paenibacillus konkukensis]
MFESDHHNYMNAVSIHQLNAPENVSLLEMFLNADHTADPHSHPNASELVYCISGAAVVSVLNPFAKEWLNIAIQPGQVANVPQGWWHYETALTGNTHVLAIFDAPAFETIPGSDRLRLTNNGCGPGPAGRAAKQAVPNAAQPNVNANPQPRYAAHPKPAFGWHPQPSSGDSQPLAYSPYWGC